MAYTGIEADSAAYRKVAASRTAGEYRDIHRVRPAAGENQIKGLAGFCRKFHSAAEIVSGSGGNITESNV